MSGGISVRVPWKLFDEVYCLGGYKIPEAKNIATYLYYVMNGQTGSNSFSVAVGMYVDCKISGEIAKGASIEDERSGASMFKFNLDISEDEFGQSQNIYIFDHVYEGAIVNSSLISTSDEYDYYDVTYRYWIFKNVEFVLPASAKLSLDGYVMPGMNSVARNYTGNVYLSLDNIPYIVPPTMIDDGINSVFDIEYHIPDVEKMEYLEFGIVNQNKETVIEFREASESNTSYTFILTEDHLQELYSIYPTVDSATIYLGARFKNVGKSPVLLSYPMTFNIAPVAPELKVVSMTDTQNISNAGKFVRYLSTLEAVVEPVAYKGASIVSYSIANSNKTIKNKKTATFTTMTSKWVDLVAKDSRGHNFKRSIELQWLDYFAPTCNISAEPPTTDDTVAVTLKGQYWDGDFGKNLNNTYTIDYKFTSNNPDNSVDWTPVSPKPTITVNSNGNFTTVFNIPTPNHVDTFTINIRFRDTFKSTISNSATVKAFPIFDWSQNDFNFNIPVAIQGDLVVTGQIVNAQMTAAIEDSIPMDFIVDQGTITTGSGNSQANWVYRKWNSGIAECWCRKHVSTAVNTAWGNLYVSGALSYTNITWGVSFTDIPVANITIAPNNSGAFLIAGGSTTLSQTNTGGYEIARGSALASAGNFYINYYAIGKWK